MKDCKVCTKGFDPEEEGGDGFCEECCLNLPENWDELPSPIQEQNIERMKNGLSCLVKIYDEQECDNCGQKLDTENPLLELPWSGVYCCDKDECITATIRANCNEPLNYEDPQNWDNE